MSDQSVSSIHSIGKVSKWDEVSDLRQDAEDAAWRFYNQLVDDRHVLQNRIAILERRLREVNGKHG